MKTSRVSRVIQILTALQSKHPYTVDDLAKMLGISRRMVFRDLNELRNVGIPCHFDRKTCRYEIDPEFFLNVPNLNPQEALGLLLLVYKARNHIHLPLKDSVLRAGLKIENNLPEEIRRYCNAALRNISIKADPQNRLDLLDQTFAQLLKTILRKQIVNIRYYLPSEQKDIVTDLSPYHLVYNDYTWYVLGGSSYHKSVRTFKLNHIKELYVSGKCFTKDKTFDISEHLGRAWSMMPEGRLYNIKLRFLPEVAHSVAEVQWHSTQTVTFQEDGSAIIEFRVDGLNEITWWIMSYGDRVQVLAPKVLRQKVIQIAQNIVKKNVHLLPA